jgi:hypothetical protein
MLKAQGSRAAVFSEPAGTAVWIALVAGSSVLFSLALACATPFAALATIAGARMRARQALALIVVAWLANQAVGYLALGYPRTWDSFAWGAAIGIAALIAVLPAALLVRRVAAPMAIVGGFVGTFVLYEAALFAATAFLPSGPEAFAPPVVWRILWINVLALVLLFLLHRAALGLRVLSPASMPEPARSPA